MTGHSKLEYQGFSKNEPQSVFSQQILRVREVMWAEKYYAIRFHWDRLVGKNSENISITSFEDEMFIN